MSLSRQNTTNIKGDVENLINVNTVKGDFVNNGTIYLVATYENCQKLLDTGMSAVAFKEAAHNYVRKMIKYHAQGNTLGINAETTMMDYYVLPRLSVVGKQEVMYPTVQNMENVFSHEETFIYGAAGSGKSTFLKYVILNTLDLNIGAIPVYISLAAFQAKCRIFPSHTLYEQILQELKEYNFPKNFVDFMLDHAPVLLLLDGFDEGYRDLNEKALLIEHIESYRKLHNGKWSRIVITSRTKDYSFLNMKRQNLELLPFDQAQVETFVKNRLGSEQAITQWLDYITSYYDITFEDRNITDNPGMDRVYERTSLMSKSGLEDERVHGVVIRERNYPVILSSPFMLSLLVLQYEQGGEIFDNKSALLKNLVKYIIEKNKSVKLLDNIFNWLSSDQLEKLFAHLAYHTLKAGEIIIEQSRLYALTENFVQSTSIYVAGGVERLFKPLVNDLGLLSVVGNNQFRFQHLFIQEYLAANFLHDNYIDEVFQNRLLLCGGWAQTMGLLLEMRAEDFAFAEKYFAVACEILNGSEPVKELVAQAREKSQDVDGKGCCGIAYYYICMNLYYNVGDRAIYSSLRIAAEILHRVMGTKQKDPMITLLTVGQEITYVAQKTAHKNLLTDGWLFRIYEREIIQRNESASLDEAAVTFKNSGNDSLLPLLNTVKLAKSENDEVNKIVAVKALLAERGLTFDYVLSVSDLNILCKWLDLVETYIRAVPSFGNNNDDYARFFKIDPPSGNIKFTTQDQDYLTSRDYFELGVRHKTINDALSEEYFSKAIAKDPTNSFFYYIRGSFYYRLKELKKALDDFLSANRLSHNYDEDYQFQLTFGDIYKKNEEFEMALQKFKKASLLVPEDISSRWYSVEIFLKIRQFAECASVCLELIRIKPDEGHFFYTTAYCFMQLEKYTEAVENIDQAIQMHYSLPESLFIKTFCQLEMGETSAVQGLLKDYLKKETTSSFLYLPLSYSYKLDKNKKLYDQTFKILLENKLLDTKTFQPMPLSISPGHIEFKRFNSSYYNEDFILPVGYNSFGDKQGADG
jgi:tetratricopeptide (TPR) repeat protein